MKTSSPAKRGIFGIGRAIFNEVQLLIRQEITLARQELTAKILHDLKAAALLLIAAPLLLLTLFLLIFFEIADLLGVLVGHFWLGVLLTWLILTILLALIAYIGFRRLRSPVPELTIASLKEDLTWLQTQLKRISK